MNYIFKSISRQFKNIYISTKECIFVFRQKNVLLSFDKDVSGTFVLRQRYLYMLYADVIWKFFVSLHIYKRVFVVSF
jgi:hypothetical protein